MWLWLVPHVQMIYRSQDAPPTGKNVAADGDQRFHFLAAFYTSILITSPTLQLGFYCRGVKHLWNVIWNKTIAVTNHPSLFQPPALTSTNSVKVLNLHASYGGSVNDNDVFIFESGKSWLCFQSQTETSSFSFSVSRQRSHENQNSNISPKHL